MYRRLMLLLLDQGYVHQRSRLAQQLGLRLLRRHMRGTAADDERAELRAILLELHASREKSIRNEPKHVLP